MVCTNKSGESWFVKEQSSCYKHVQKKTGEKLNGKALWMFTDGYSGGTEIISTNRIDKIDKNHKYKLNRL